MVGDLGHILGKRAEILFDSLVDKYVSVGEIEDTFFEPRLFEPVYDLKRGVGFACAGSHHEQKPVFALGYAFDSFVDGTSLVVSRLVKTFIPIIWLFDYIELLRSVVVKIVHTLHKLFGSWKLVYWYFLFGMRQTVVLIKR